MDADTPRPSPALTDQRQEPLLVDDSDGMSPLGLSVDVEQFLPFCFRLPVRRLIAYHHDIGKPADSLVHDRSRLPRELLCIRAANREATCEYDSLPVQRTHPRA